MDLVINHTAKDALLVEQHPEWFKREADGELRSPRAVDPVDPRKFTVWGDLAELDYDNPAHQAAQVDYWAGLIRHHLKLGFKGFRCDAAYQVPAAIWRPLIAAGEGRPSPSAASSPRRSAARPRRCWALKDAGFDYLFNSAKWWDFRSPWLLEQYDLYRQVAPTIAFPESHDTERLAIELGDPPPAELARQYRLRYLFAACFSSGVMMPMGFEYGCRTRLDVVASRPGDWQWESAQPRIDLTGFIGAVNRMRAACPALNREGAQRKITAPNSPVVGLLRLSGGDLPSSEDAAIVLVNPDPARAWGVDPGPLLGQVGGRISDFEDVTPEAPPLPLRAGPAAHARAPAAPRVPRQGARSAAGAGDRQGRAAGEREAAAWRSPPTAW